MNPILDVCSTGAALTDLILPSFFVQEETPDSYTVWGVFSKTKIQIPTDILGTAARPRRGSARQNGGSDDAGMGLQTNRGFFRDFFSD